MSGIETTLVIAAAIIGGWYLFEWLWDRRLFFRGDETTFCRNLRARRIRKVIESASPAPKIVDVRPEADFQRGAIPGAENIPFTGPEFSEQVRTELSEDEPLVIYCSGGFRSRRAAKELRRLGFQKLYHLHRGIGSWKMAGFPIESDG